MSADLTYAGEARDRWREYATHREGCAECDRPDVGTGGCARRRELRHLAEQADKLIDPGHGAESSRLRKERAVHEPRKHARSGRCDCARGDAHTTAVANEEDVRTLRDAATMLRLVDGERITADAARRDGDATAASAFDGDEYDGCLTLSEELDAIADRASADAPRRGSDGSGRDRCVAPATPAGHTGRPIGKVRLRHAGGWPGDPA